jgi:hypothetical protein
MLFCQTRAYRTVLQSYIHQDSGRDLKVCPIVRGIADSHP